MSEQRKASKEEKVIRFLQYLKENTDEKHKASLPMIEKYFSERYYPHYFGDKNTRKNTIKEIVRVLNSDSEGNLLPFESWTVVYDDFVRDHITEPAVEHKEHHICNIYYRHPFTKSELYTILSCIQNAPSEKVSDDQKEDLIRRLTALVTDREFFDRELTPDQRTRLAREKRQADAYLRYLFNRRFGQDDDW